MTPTLVFPMMLSSNISWIMAAILLLLWVATVYYFLWYRKRVKRKLRKMIGMITIKNSHELKRLKESEEKFHCIADQMNEGLIITDSEQKIVYTNRAACDLLRRKSDKLHGTRLSEYAAGVNEASRLDAMIKKMSSSSKARDEFMMLRSENEMFWVSIGFSHPPKKSGLNDGIIIVMVDITQHIILEQKMRKLTNNLVQKVRQLDCVFDMQKILSEPDLIADTVIKHALKIIPHGLRYENDMRVEIVYKGKRYQTPGYKETQWYYKVPLKVNNNPIGHLTVSYVGAQPPRHSQPFRIGEKVLLKNLAEKMVNAIET